MSYELYLIIININSMNNWNASICDKVEQILSTICAIIQWHKGIECAHTQNILEGEW